jgi:hypothetical protein
MISTVYRVIVFTLGISGMVWSLSSPREEKRKEKKENEQ